MNAEYVSNFVRHQFPDFYKQEGANFVQFVKAYYEWEETRSKTRKLLEYRDVDTTPDDMLEHFRNKYMSGVPKQILGDKRLLQKHVLDLYNSKGSIEGVRLVFRLLFNTEIEYYVPAVDIFKPDNSEWFEPRYFEVSKIDTNYLFESKNITGRTSRAKAIVENYERRAFDGRLFDLLFVSNISGTFLPGEAITFEGIDIAEPVILGSVDHVVINSSTPGFVVGEEVSITSPVDGRYFEGMVSAANNSGVGIINFAIANGGFGYTTNSTITITPGSNTTGTGAAMAIIALSNTSVVSTSNSLVYPYLSVLVGANAYSYGVGDVSPMATANLSSVIYPSLGMHEVTVGTISQIATTNPGVNYDGNVNVRVVEPSTVSLHIPDGNGNFWGNDAVITSSAFYGNGVPSYVTVVSSGIGYRSNNGLVDVTLTSTTNSLHVINATLVLGAVGKVEGYWRDTSSFVDNDKYLQDDDYYQEYSYELILRKKINEYYDVLKATVHPSGNKMFGKVRLVTEN
jgi:hypothetical protein